MLRMRASMADVVGPALGGVPGVARVCFVVASLGAVLGSSFRVRVPCATNVWPIVGS